MLIPRENFIVFGENLELGINFERTSIICFCNSKFIRSLSRDFSFQGQRVFYVNICVFVCN